MGPLEQHVGRIHTDKEMENSFSVDCAINCVLSLDPKYSDVLPSHFFEPQALENAKEICIMDTELEELPSCFTLHLVNVSSLKLRRNKFKTLPNNLNRLISIENLDLSHNCLENLPQDLDTLTSLKCLNVASNNLNSVPNCLCHLEYLQNLNISMNGLKSLPDNIGQLKSLTSLNVSRNSLESLPESLCNLVKLEELNVSRNKLNCIPNSLSQIINLRSLDISGNELTELPTCVTYGLSQLLYLDVSHNKLSSLNSVPRCMHSLLLLNASYNDIQNVPQWVFEDSCRKLQSVDLSYNLQMHGSTSQPISALRGSCPISFLNVSNCSLMLNTVSFLFGLNNLDTLHMGNKKSKSKRCQEGNMFLILPINVLGTCSTLRELHLPDVGLSDLPDTVDQLAAHLEVLDLAYNELRWLPDTFCLLKQLTHCRLTQNRIVLLPSGIGDLSRLKNLQIDSNMLESLPNSMEQLSSLILLDLYDNLLESVPTWMTCLPNLEAMDIDRNCFDADSCLDKIHGELHTKYLEMKRILRMKLNTVERQHECKTGPEILDEYETESSCSEQSNSQDELCESGKDELLDNPLEGEANVSATERNSVYIKCEEEEWDSVVDPANYFDPHMPIQKIQPPPQPVFHMKETASSPLDDFCPRDLHPPIIGKKRPLQSGAAEAGQFDDAD